MGVRISAPLIYHETYLLSLISFLDLIGASGSTLLRIAELVTDHYITKVTPV